MASNKYISWWSDATEVHAEVFDAVNSLEESQRYRHDLNLSNMRLYGNAHIQDLRAMGYSRVSKKRERVTLNVIQSMCDTVTSRITKNRPKATFLTSGGDFTMQSKAKLLDKFVRGQFYEAGIYDIAPKVFLDACVFGTGIIKVYETDGKVKIERVFPNEVMVDDAEAIYGAPRQLFQTKYISRQVLLSAYPEFKAKILEASNGEERESWSEESLSDQVRCVEAWYLPSAKDAEDGRHVICIDTATLSDERWRRDYFPFVQIRWTERLLGYWGQGLAEQLTGVQVEINTLLQRIQHQMHLATPKVFIETGAKISKAHINNEAWGIIEYSGTPPQFFVPKTVSGEIFSHLDRLLSEAYAISGISQLSAQARKPAGLDSGVALREFSDIESERFVYVGQAYERMFLAVAHQLVDLAREISDRGDTYDVISHGDKTIERIKWSDINLDEDKYVMKVFPTSLLPMTPAAKLQSVQEMLQAGLLTLQEGRALLDYPDLESVNMLATAAQEDAMMLIDEMLNKGRYHPPEPFSNLPLTMKLIQSAYLRAKVDKAPEERLELLRRYLEDAMALLTAPPAQEPLDMSNVTPMAGPQEPQQMGTAPAPTQDMMAAEAAPQQPALMPPA